MEAAERTSQVVQGRTGDQASSLRELVSSRKKEASRFEGLRSIAVVSGKGGVGKTNLSVNLALALGEMGFRTAILDADLGLANADLLFGIVPKYDSDEVKMTITLKENFIPWRKDWGKGWQFEPLECTLYLNTVLGHDFWTKQPTKYESGYYPFSTRIRPNLGFGERFTYQIPNNRRKRVKSLTLFYELSTNDIYFMRFYRNGNAGFWDVFGLSIGAKVQYL